MQQLELLGCLFGGSLKRAVRARNSSKWGAPQSHCTTFLNLLAPMIAVTMGFLWHCLSSAPMTNVTVNIFVERFQWKHNLYTENYKEVIF